MATVRTLSEEALTTWFESYFGIADELDGGLTLNDLEPDYVHDARCWKNLVGDAPWPPELWWAEEWENQVRQLYEDVHPDVLLSSHYTNERLSRRFG